MGRKARREALLEVETIEDDAAIWDELSRATLKRGLGFAMRTSFWDRVAIDR